MVTPVNGITTTVPTARTNRSDEKQQQSAPEKKTALTAARNLQAHSAEEKKAEGHARKELLKKDEIAKFLDGEPTLEDGKMTAKLKEGTKFDDFEAALKEAGHDTELHPLSHEHGENDITTITLGKEEKKDAEKAGEEKDTKANGDTPKWVQFGAGAGIVAALISLYNLFAKSSKSALKSTQDQVQNAFGGVGQAMQGMAQQIAQNQQIVQLQSDTNATNNDTLNTLLAALTGQPVPQSNAQQQPTPQTAQEPNAVPAHSAPASTLRSMHAAPDAGQAAQAQGGQQPAPAAGQQPQEGGQQSDALTQAQKQNEEAHKANEAAKQAAAKVQQQGGAQSQVAHTGGAQPTQQGPVTGQPLPPTTANDGNYGVQPGQAGVKWTAQGEALRAIPNANGRASHGGNTASKKYNVTGDRVIIDEDSKEAA